MYVSIHNSKKNRILWSSVTVGVLILTALFVFVFLRGKADTKQVNVIDTESQPADTTSDVIANPKIHVSAMGDMLAHDTINANAKTNDGYDYSQFFANIRPSYNDSDIVFCNQEGLSSGEAFGISGYPSFNAPKQFSEGLQTGAGCNLINLANNHIGDKGVKATNATIDNWLSLKPLATSGANKSVDAQNSTEVFTVKGIKVGFASFADFNNNKSTPAYSVNIYHDEALVRRLITDLKTKSDAVIVSMHWGTEDSASVNDDQKAQVALLASLGVDVIIGTGPHVLQKVETITRPDGGSLLVWYSIGNMLSSQLQVNELVGGIAGFDVEKLQTGGILINNISFMPTYMHYEWTVAQKESDDLLSRKNAMIYMLKDASIPLSRSLLNTTIEAQKQYVISVLGGEVSVK